MSQQFFNFCGKAVAGFFSFRAQFFYFQGYFFNFRMRLGYIAFRSQTPAKNFRLQSGIFLKKSILLFPDFRMPFGLNVRKPCLFEYFKLCLEHQELYLTGTSGLFFLYLICQGYIQGSKNLLNKKGCPGNEATLEKTWWARQDSNLGPTGYEPGALPTELWAQPDFF